MAPPPDQSGDDPSVGGSSLENLESDSDLSFLVKVARVRPSSSANAFVGPQSGDRIGGHDGKRFEIIEMLGRGAMGYVYRAWDPVLERDAAIKVILSPASAPPEDVL